MSDSTERDWVSEVGAPAYASIREMVAALLCDYDRLEELREERDDFEPVEMDDPSGPLTWAQANPDDAEELADLEKAAGDHQDSDSAREFIQDDALSVQVRSGWVSPGEETMAPEEFELLLTTGGPAVRIVGELDEHGEPYRAWLEVQDWGKPWTQYFPADPDTLLAYAQCFSYGS